MPRYGSKSAAIAFTASNTASCVIAAVRACANGFCAALVATMIEFHSITASGSRERHSPAMAGNVHNVMAAVSSRMLVLMGDSPSAMGCIPVRVHQRDAAESWYLLVIVLGDA